MNSEKLAVGFERASISIGDEIGMVLFSENMVLRAIHEGHVEKTHELLESGLIDELVRRRLFPETRVSAHKVAGHSLVLEHKKIDPLIYPYEWSPEMLRRAGLCVLEVNQCANAYGYELKDAHPFNVMFSFGKAWYVDFGSFSKTKSPSCWLAGEEFVNSYIRVLMLAEKGMPSFYRHAFLISGRGFNGHEIMVATNRLSSLIGARFTQKLLKLVAVYRIGPTISDELISSRFPGLFMRTLARAFLKSKFAPFRNIDYASLENKLRSFKLSAKSEWGDYQDRSGFYAPDGSISLSSRMKWIVDVVADLSPASILELAGNQGVLARELAKLPGMRRVICSDYDEKSIDQLLIRTDESDRVDAACFDFMADLQGRLSGERANRYRSDVVIALAVTHHLILSQRYAIDSIFSTFSAYTNKYLIVEFMPLGLWDGEASSPLPDWYTESWFSENMAKYFRIVSRTALEDNRIIFIGEVLSQRGNRQSD